eukprot:g19202.t1
MQKLRHEDKAVRFLLLVATLSLEPRACLVLLLIQGVYVKGKRKGQACVGKVFKTGPVLEASYFSTDLQVVEKAMDIISKYNKGNFIDKMILLNQPEVWTFTEDTKAYAGQKIFTEPLIQNWEKFNLNSGLSAGDGTP